MPEHRASPRYLREVNVSNTLIANNADITNLARERAKDLRHVNREIPNTIESPPHRSARRRVSCPAAQYRSNRARVARAR